MCLILSSSPYVPTIFFTELSIASDNRKQSENTIANDTFAKMTLVPYDVIYAPETDAAGRSTQDSYAVNYAPQTDSVSQVTQEQYNANYTFVPQEPEQGHIPPYGEMPTTQGMPSSMGYQETEEGVSRQPSEVHFYGTPASGATTNGFYEGDSFEHLKVQPSETSLSQTEASDAAALQGSQATFDYYSVSNYQV